MEEEKEEERRAEDVGVSLNHFPFDVAEIVGSQPQHNRADNNKC